MPKNETPPVGAGLANTSLLGGFDNRDITPNPKKNQVRSSAAVGAVPPLLAICEGRKPRARKAPVIRPREIQLHLDVARVLRDHAVPEWLWWHTPNGELRDKRAAAKLRAMGVRPGVPDFLLISPHGSVRLLELKRPGETLSDAQEEFRIHCVRHGIAHAIAHNFDQALVALDHWACLRIRITPRPDRKEPLVILPLSLATQNSAAARAKDIP
jgi:hypothetical protein